MVIRLTGRLDPNPADLAYGSLELAALEYQARRGEIIVLYEDETILWRFALPRAGWWRTAQRVRLPIRPLSQSHINREESLKRQAWLAVSLLEPRHQRRGAQRYWRGAVWHRQSLL
jgi:hypothetical protein